MYHQQISLDLLTYAIKNLSNLTTIYVFLLFVVSLNRYELCHMVKPKCQIYIYLLIRLIVQKLLFYYFCLILFNNNITK